MDSREKPSITVDECAELFGLAPNSIRSALARGDIPSLRIGRRIIISRRKVLEMLNGSAQPVAKS